jgi:hypothetical protein
MNFFTSFSGNGVQTQNAFRATGVDKILAPGHALTCAYAGRGVCVETLSRRCRTDDAPRANQGNFRTPRHAASALSHRLRPLVAAFAQDSNPPWRMVMSGLDEVFESLKQMSQLQLLLAFITFIAYGLAQGGLLGPRGRGRAWVVAVAGAAGFVLLGADWPKAAMLVAIAVAGLGSFTAMVWLICRIPRLRHELDAPSPPPAATPAAAPADPIRPHTNRPVAST